MGGGVSADVDGFMKGSRVGMGGGLESGEMGGKGTGSRGVGVVSQLGSLS